MVAGRGDTGYATAGRVVAECGVVQCVTPYLHDAQYATRLLGAVLCLQFSVPPFLVSLFPVPQFLVPHMPAAQFPASQLITCATIPRPIVHRHERAWRHAATTGAAHSSINPQNARKTNAMDIACPAPRT